MKKFILLFFVVVATTGFAQKNIVKVGLAGISYGDYSLHYERALTLNGAINATIGYMAPKNGFISLDSTFTFGGGILFKEFKTGFHASLDYKFYVGNKGVLRGLYVAPYLRYFNYSMLLTDDIKQDMFDVNTNFSSIGAGFQLGYQWLIKDRISIDWFIIGIGAEYLTPKLVYTTSTAGFDYSTILDDMTDVVVGWTYLEKRLKTTSTAENATATLSTLFPGFKTGITIGYAF